MTVHKRCRPRTYGALALALGLVLGPAGSAWATKPAKPPKPMTVKVLAPMVKEATACTMLHPVRCDPLQAIVGQGAAVVGPATLTLLGKPDPATRAVAAAIAGQVKLADAGPKLLTLLGDKDPRVRLAAIAAVGRINPDGAVAALSKALGTEDVNEKLVTTVALGETRSPAAFTPLLSQLTHFHPKVKAAACRALGSLGDKRATPALAVMLADPKVPWPAKQAAAAALGKLRDQNAVGMLLQVTGHDEDKVRVAAIDALGNIGDARAVGAISLLMRQPSLAMTAAIALGRIQHADALPALIRVLKERKHGSEVIEKAFWAAGEIKSASAVPALRPMLKDEDPRIVVWAADALGRIGDEKAAEALLDALRRDEQEVKEMAAWALQQLSGINLGLDIERWETWVYDPTRNPE